VRGTAEQFQNGFKTWKKSGISGVHIFLLEEVGQSYVSSFGKARKRCRGSC